MSVFPSASQKLLQCVQQELGLEQKILTQLPTISKFETSIAGSLATLQCKHNQEEWVNVLSPPSSNLAQVWKIRYVCDITKMVETWLPAKKNSKIWSRVMVDKCSFCTHQRSTAIIRDDMLLAHSDCKEKDLWPFRVFFQREAFLFWQTCPKVKIRRI